MSELVRLRKSKNMSQADLAKKIGTTPVAISRYETGNRQPNGRMILLIGKTFHLSVNSLWDMFYGKDPPTPTNVPRKEA